MMRQPGAHVRVTGLQLKPGAQPPATTQSVGSGVHVPELHTRPELHCTPQPPQLFSSLKVSRHVVPQRESVPPHGGVPASTPALPPAVEPPPEPPPTALPPPVWLLNPLHVPREHVVPMLHAEHDNPPRPHELSRRPETHCPS